MTLYISVVIDGKRDYYEWHVGKVNPIPASDRHYVTSVQADCGELEFIHDNFSGIPCRLGKRVVQWYGDDAKFIAGNI